MSFMTKSRALSAFASICVLGIAAGAYAYFTTSGSGTGSASVGTGSAVTLHGTVASSLYPGSSSSVSFTVDNPSSGAQRVNTISLASISADAGHSGCGTVLGGGNPDFTMAPVAVNKTVAPGAGQAVSQTGTLTMNETGVNQDACQGATLTLNLSNN
jgi:hypothetical protein